ncbi:MAG: nucleotidyltransferase substrate binding protein [Oscillospiraceae bacterium]|jgi:nucleotidyltransferase substrate binding protein (TIGR01987 family)|nr:nucleotidyltransferase substrate binding protein [Oscillospiraceae bacterium]
MEPLRRAVGALGRSCAVWAALPEEQHGGDMAETLRAGVIQSFEFTYELCWKFMRRWLEMNIAADAADGVTRRELFRLCAEQKLLDDVEVWMGFHFARNITSHVYDAEKAEEVLAAALAFLPVAENLLGRLEEKA